ncbi:MAG TPA: alpha/beta hydrolase [Solirubrobacteraceae bacterium]|nr:alpha/beta hydrolase [Solirubrobacteraceae bacterium]
MTRLVRQTDDEAGALVRLGFDELRGFTESIATTERDIAGRVFGYVPAGRPIQFVHDAVAGAVAGALGGAASAAGRGAAGLVVRRPRPQRPLSATLPGGIGLAVLNGLIGDRLERDGSPLQEPMSVRVGGLPVAPDRAALAAAFPQATPRLVVFVHGLMGEEHGWRLGRRQGREDYGSRLARDLGCTPLYVRYNSGRHISENGRSLADLLEAIVAAWPVEAEEIALVGHSMGGLVARSACYRAALDEAAWVANVRHVISLGSPHLGAPLEQAVHVASHALGRLPETRMYSTFLRRRSSGIRDLRQGSLVDEDWRDRDPEALRAAACQEVPLLEGATHCFVSATVTRSPRHPVGRVVGDTLVLTPSASGRSRTRKLGFEDEYGLHVGATNHIALLNHPAVYEKLHTWLR